MKVKLLILIIVQCFVIIGLFFFIYKKKLNEKPTINALSAKTISRDNQSSYTYYYELPANTELKEIITNSPYNTINYVNSDTLHELKDYPVIKEEDTYRIITLGDSFTFGLFVKTHENWTELLEKQLSEEVKCKKIEVINLGVSGYDIQYSIERFRIRGQKYNPDLVIFFLRGEDIWQLNDKMRASIEKIEKAMGNISDHGNLNAGFAWETVFKRFQNDMSEDELIKIQSTNLVELNKYYQGDLLLMALPTEQDLLVTVLENYISRNDNSTLLQLKTDLEQDSSLVFPNDGHPNQAGHTLIAGELTEYVMNNYVNCNDEI